MKKALLLANAALLLNMVLPGIVSAVKIDGTVVEVQQDVAFNPMRMAAHIGSTGV